MAGTVPRTHRGWVIRSNFHIGVQYQHITITIMNIANTCVPKWLDTCNRDKTKQMDLQNTLAAALCMVWFHVHSSLQSQTTMPEQYVYIHIARSALIGMNV